MIGLQDEVSGHDLQFQVLAIDGVTTDISPQATTSSLNSLFAGKLRITECMTWAGAPTAKPRSEPVCADRIRMMPSSRVDVWVSQRNAGLRAKSASLRTYNFSTGDAGDIWPGDSGGADGGRPTIRKSTVQTVRFKIRPSSSAIWLIGSES